MRSNAIVTNIDDHDRPGQHWIAFYIDEHGTGTYFDSYGLSPLDSRFLSSKLHHISLEYNDAARNTFSLADNIAMYFYILCVMVIILDNFLVCLFLIVNAMID